jgi:hypothetical protein
MRVGAVFDIPTGKLNFESDVKHCRTILLLFDAGFRCIEFFAKLVHRDGEKTPFASSTQSFFFFRERDRVRERGKR